MTHKITAYVPVEPCDYIAAVIVSVGVIALVLARVDLFLVGFERVDDTVV